MDTLRKTAVHLAFFWKGANSRGVSFNVCRGLEVIWNDRPFGFVMVSDTDTGPEFLGSQLRHLQYVSERSATDLLMQIGSKIAKDTNTSMKKFYLSLLTSSHPDATRLKDGSLSWSASLLSIFMIIKNHDDDCPWLPLKTGSFLFPTKTAHKLLLFLGFHWRWTIKFLKQRDKSSLWSRWNRRRSASGGDTKTQSLEATENNWDARWAPIL